MANNPTSPRKTTENSTNPEEDIALPTKITQQISDLRPLPRDFLRVAASVASAIDSAAQRRCHAPRSLHRRWRSGPPRSCRGSLEGRWKAGAGRSQGSRGRVQEISPNFPKDLVSKQRLFGRLLGTTTANAWYTYFHVDFSSHQSCLVLMVGDGSLLLTSLQVAQKHPGSKMGLKDL